MSVLFTPAQENRIAEIVRSIFTDVFQGADARIREAIKAEGRDGLLPGESFLPPQLTLAEWVGALGPQHSREGVETADREVTNSAATSLTAADETRIQTIIREELDDDYALDNSRSHEEFLVESQRMRSHRFAKERKRNGDLPNA